MLDVAFIDANLPAFNLDHPEKRLSETALSCSGPPYHSDLFSGEDVER